MSDQKQQNKKSQIVDSENVPSESSINEEFKDSDTSKEEKQKQMRLEQNQKSTVDHSREDLKEPKVEKSALLGEAAKSALPGEVEESALPKEAEIRMLLEETEKSALPEEAGKSALPEEAKQSTLLEEAEMSAFPEKVTQSTFLEEVKQCALVEKTEISALVEEAETRQSAFPEEAEVSTLPEESGKSALPQEVKQSVFMEKAEEAEMSTLPEESGKSALPQEVKQNVFMEKAKESVLSEAEMSTLPEESGKSVLPQEVKQSVFMEEAKESVLSKEAEPSVLPEKNVLPEGAEHAGVENLWTRVGAAVIILIAVGVALCANQFCGTQTSDSRSALQIFQDEFKQLQKDFPEQNRNVWLRSGKMLTNHLNKSHPDEPAMIMLTAAQDAKRTLLCLGSGLAQTYAVALNSSWLLIRGPSEAQYDSSTAKLHIDEKLSSGFETKHRAAVLNRLETLPPGSLLILYKYCDHENAAYKNVALIFTVLLEDSSLEPDTPLPELEEKVRDFLWQTFIRSGTIRSHQEMDSDKLGGVWSRISHLVLPVLPVKRIEAGNCPFDRE
ncbi:uncharacterized protein LOC143928291 isoform X2 [Lithobates pipiens]